MTNLAMESYRALDLTDDKGFLCGKILADVGVDVIKIEPPEGDPARRIGPFYHDIPDSQKSLYWFAYNANKRGITLNIECEDGKEVFRKLVKGADFVIESFSPGYMEGLGLGYGNLSKINPRIILTSITGFGQDGPYRDFQATDIVGMAMGGFMYVNGEPGKAPLRFCVPLAYLHAASEAAVGTMIAHYHREVTQEGQWVDQSMQQSIIGTLHNVFQTWDLTGENLTSAGIWYRLRPPPATGVRAVWPCKDGFVSFILLGAAIGAKMNEPLVQWMDEEGMCPPLLKKINWRELDVTEIPADIREATADALLQFFMTHTKAELYEGALKWRTLVYPVADPKDIGENAQLAARDFWVKLDHPELGDSISYPGPFVKASETPLKIRCRAPLVGEHNQEIYEGELDFSRSELSILKENGVI